MSQQFNDEDKKAVSQFLGLLVNLGATPIEAFQTVDPILQYYGWSFVYFNDIEDFWITDNEMK